MSACAEDVNYIIYLIFIIEIIYHILYKLRNIIFYQNVIAPWRIFYVFTIFVLSFFAFLQYDIFIRIEHIIILVEKSCTNLDR